MSDPVRLLGRGTNDAVARALLESGVTAEPTLAQRDEVWRAVARKLPEAALAGAAAGAIAKTATSKTVAVASSAKALGAGMLAKGAVTVAVLGVAATVASSAAWYASSEEPTPSVAPAAPLAAPRLATPPAGLPDVATAPGASAVVVEADEPRPPPVPRRPASGSRAASPAAPAPTVEEATAPTQDDTVGAESARILAARRTLRSGDCTGALRDLEAVRADHPGGALVEEVDVLSIESLACAGRPAEAAARASAFLRDHPTSPHRAGVRRFAR